jgi:hypothetical protein
MQYKGDKDNDQNEKYFKGKGIYNSNDTIKSEKKCKINNGQKVGHYLKQVP